MQTRTQRRSNESGIKGTSRSAVHVHVQNMKRRCDLGTPPQSPPKSLPHPPSVHDSSTSSSTTDQAVLAYDDTPSQPLTVPKGDITEFDVLFKIHNASNMWEGNRRYRQIVRDHLQAYLTAKPGNRLRVAERVYDAVRSQGGRFLKRSTAGEEEELWVEADKKVALSKTQCRFREEKVKNLQRDNKTRYRKHKAKKEDRRYRQLRRDHLQAFLNVKGIANKQRVAARVYKIVCLHGGRFLKLDTAGEEEELWVEVDMG